MSSDLELHPVQYNSHGMSETTGEIYPDALHSVYVSPKLYKVIVGGSKKSESVLVSVREPESDRSVVATLFSVDESISSFFDTTATGIVHLPPNLLVTLFPEREIPITKTVLVGLFPIIPKLASSVFLSEVCGSGPYSDSVHRIALARFFEVPRHLSVGEFFAIPTWTGGEILRYNEISERDAEVVSWIGPGRALDIRKERIHYYVSELKAADTDRSCSHVVCEDVSNVLLVGHRPGRPFACSSLNRSLDDWEQSLAAWVVRPTGPCLFVAKRGPSRVERLVFLLSKFGFFSDRFDCLLNPADPPPGDHFVLLIDNYEAMNMHPLIFGKSRVICLVENFEKVKKPMHFSLFLEPSQISNDLLDSYTLACPDSSACLLARLSAPSTTSVACPTVLWEDIGGLEDAKEELRDLLTLSLRRGVLLFGPPGTGKTLLAKAIATQCGSGFISVKGPELLSPYIGESEKNIRQVFELARLQGGRCVIFFDELDSLAPSRGRASDSANVMDRVVASLLSELDALPETVLLVGATNRPDLLDPALLRPGRLDRHVYVGIPLDKRPLLRALARQFALEPGVIENLAPLVPKTMTGSDLAGLLRRAYLKAVKEEPRRGLTLSLSQIVAALKLVTPSVTEAELRQYELLRDKHHGSQL